MRNEFYVKTLLALYRADIISFKRLKELLEREFEDDINSTFLDNIERENIDWNYNFMWNARDNILKAIWKDF